MNPITVLLADDNRLVRTEYRKSLALEADLKVVGEARDGRHAVELVGKLLPHLVLMDVAMPRVNGLEATRQIVLAYPATKVIMLSAYNDIAYVVAAFEAGAMGYLIKQTSADLVAAAIRAVDQGKRYFSPSIPQKLQQRLS